MILENHNISAPDDIIDEELAKFVKEEQWRQGGGTGMSSSPRASREGEDEDRGSSRGWSGVGIGRKDSRGGGTPRSSRLATSNAAEQQAVERAMKAKEEKEAKEAERVAEEVRVAERAAATAAAILKRPGMRVGRPRRLPTRSR